MLHKYSLSYYNILFSTETMCNLSFHQKMLLNKHYQIERAMVYIISCYHDTLHSPPQKRLQFVDMIQDITKLVIDIISSSTSIPKDGALLQDIIMSCHQSELKEVKESLDQDPFVMHDKLLRFHVRQVVQTYLTQSTKHLQEIIIFNHRSFEQMKYSLTIEQCHCWDNSRIVIVHGDPHEDCCNSSSLLSIVVNYHRKANHNELLLNIVVFVMMVIIVVVSHAMYYV